MSEASPPPPPSDDERQSRWRFIGDVLVLQLKLLLGNLHNLLLIPVTLGAAVLDLLFKAKRPGARFYRVLDWGRKADEAIGLYNALDRDEENPQHDFTVDALVSRLEAVIVREYAKGGTAATIKEAVDHALDQVVAKTGKGTAKAQEAAQRLMEKMRRGDEKQAP